MKNIKEKKRPADIWAEFTYGAWWIPYKTDTNFAGEGRRYRTSTIFKCNKCEEVYSYDPVSKRPILYYYKEMPKRQTVKTCVACLGNKVHILNM